jgi:hypothetical protein
MNSTEIAKLIRKAKRSKSGWTGLCPAHNDSCVRRIRPRVIARARELLEVPGAAVVVTL